MGADPVAMPSSRWGVGLVLLLSLAVFLGVSVGSEGWEPLGSDTAPGLPSVLWDIRVPRTLGTLVLGALLGLSGTLAQGLFRNPLADPYLLGAGSGAGLAVTVAAATAGSFGATAGTASAIGVAFGGALGAVLLTLALARGAAHTHRLLLAGLVVAAVLAALTDLVSALVPEAWRHRQGLLLGRTHFLDQSALAWLSAGLLLALPVSWGLGRFLDALSLGEDVAQSLGLSVRRWRLVLVAVMAGCTALAVALAGLIGFVALVAPHVVRSVAPGNHRVLLLGSAGVGGGLLLLADVACRWLFAPLELPVGVATGIGGGLYLLWLLRGSGPLARQGGLG